ncbi:hypothetical protein [Nonomuraea diastatica]|uniref:hypothetical protein n=1 Tax=Nonomuraea diastatica TaxID=1848329 RepID=UPI00140CD916|nr:hypothetical protein [Nonomuraea diastatica]
MEDFAAGVRRRVSDARAAHRLALESGDFYAARVHAADLEEMVRLAEDHGIIVEPGGEG